MGMILLVSHSTVVCLLLSPVMAPPTMPVTQTDGLFGSESLTAERLPSGAILFAGQPNREWSDCFGNIAKGSLTGSYGAIVHVIIDGEPIVLPLVSLSSADREYVRSQFHAVGRKNDFPGQPNLEDAAAKMRLSTADWNQQLKRWADSLCRKSPEKTAEAEAAWNHLRAIQDPQAVKILARWAMRPTNTTVRLACIESLASIGNKEAIRVLVEIAVTDRSGLVRQMATWSLSQVNDLPTVLDEYAKFLSAPMHRDVALLNLHVIGSVQPYKTQHSPPCELLLESLIGILTVKHTVKIPYRVWWGYDTGWMPRPGGVRRRAHLHIEPRVARFVLRVPCELAHKLLVQYTQEDFGYDRQAWQNWMDERRQSVSD